MQTSRGKQKFTIPEEGWFELTATDSKGNTIRRCVLKNLKQVEEMGVFEAPELSPKQEVSDDQ